MSNIQRIGVLGAGTMGHGIAQVCVMAGFDVALTDPSADVLGKAKGRVCDGLEKLVAKGQLDGDALHAAINRLSLVPTLAEAVSKADLVIEAAPEKIEIKTTLFAEMDAAAPAHAILATNTSSLKVSAMAAVTKRGGQVIGTHFFNPVPVMALLEIVRAESTSDATVDAGLAGFLERWGDRAVAEIDLGMPRWREQPEHLRGTLRNYALVTDESAGPRSA